MSADLGQARNTAFYTVTTDGTLDLDVLDARFSGNIFVNSQVRLNSKEHHYVGTLSLAD